MKEDILKNISLRNWFSSTFIVFIVHKTSQWNRNCLVIDIYQNIFLYVSKYKESNTGLEQHKVSKLSH